MNSLPWEAVISGAVKFSHKWKEAKKEEADAQPFTLDFIKIFGAGDPLEAGGFEVKVNLDMMVTPAILITFGRKKSQLR